MPRINLQGADRTFEALPEGDYVLRAIKTDPIKTNANGHRQLPVQFEVQSEELQTCSDGAQVPIQGRRVFHNFYLGQVGAQQLSSLWSLEQFLTAAGIAFIKLENPDTGGYNIDFELDDIQDKMVLGYLVLNTYTKDNELRVNNNIKKFSALTN